ncbi:MAG: YifB family Mg chelatase-like AAA ATPase [Butyrivibrio sp.]
MIGRAYCAMLHGTMVNLVEIEADVSNGLPGFELTGNLGGTVKEGRDRVKAAIKNSGIALKPSKITVNLAPSNLRKDGTQFDLAMAVAVICAEGLVSIEEIKDTVFIGELGLDGKVNPVRAVLPIVSYCKEAGMKRCIVPKGNIYEGAYIHGIDVVGVDTLSECIGYLKNSVRLNPVDKAFLLPLPYEEYDMDYSDIKGQKGLKRAMVIAAGGMHNILMVGPPGAGKTMTASRLVTIMPPPDATQCMEISRIYSIAGLLTKDKCFIRQRPFRAPNYTITPAAMAGGGVNPLPGEMSLAVGGVLFLDELNMFSPEVIETLRVPLESRSIRINRAGGVYEFPADFMLVAAINPCRCGYYPDKRCNCTKQDIRKYMGRLSSPILDRIDMCIHAPKVEYDDIEGSEEDVEYSSGGMRRKVLNIYNVQQERYRNFSFQFNSQIPVNMVSDICTMENDAKTLIKTVYRKYDLTARSYHRIMKVSRTIADLEGHERIMLNDIGEAVGYRMPDIQRML